MTWHRVKEHAGSKCMEVVLLLCPNVNTFHAKIMNIFHAKIMNTFHANQTAQKPVTHTRTRTHAHTHTHTTQTYLQQPCLQNQFCMLWWHWKHPSRSQNSAGNHREKKKNVSRTTMKTTKKKKQSNTVIEGKGVLRDLCSSRTMNVDAEKRERERGGGGDLVWKPDMIEGACMQAYTYEHTQACTHGHIQTRKSTYRLLRFVEFTNLKIF